MSSCFLGKYIFVPHQSFATEHGGVVRPHCSQLSYVTHRMAHTSKVLHFQTESTSLPHSRKEYAPLQCFRTIDVYANSKSHSHGDKPGVLGT